MAEITKKQFVATLKALKEQYKLDYQNAQLLESVFPQSEVMGYDNSMLVGTIIKLLQVHFPKVDGICPIETHCFDAHFYSFQENESEYYDNLWKKLTDKK